jgi:hypothetical protein
MAHYNYKLVLQLCIFSKMGHFEDCEYITVDTNVLESDVKAVNILGKEFAREISDNMFEAFMVSPLHRLHFFT